MLATLLLCGAQGALPQVAHAQSAGSLCDDGGPNYQCLRDPSDAGLTGRDLMVSPLNGKKKSMIWKVVSDVGRCGGQIRVDCCPFSSHANCNRYMNHQIVMIKNPGNGYCVGNSINLSSSADAVTMKSCETLTHGVLASVFVVGSCNGSGDCFLVNVQSSNRWGGVWWLYGSYSPFYAYIRNVNSILDEWSWPGSNHF